jgi:hypothetical protein
MILSGAATADVLAKLLCKYQQHIRLCTVYVETHPVTTNLFPLDLLAGDGKLSSQTFESALVEFCESLIDFCLVALLELSDFTDGIAGVGGRNGLGGLEAHVAILVVVNVDVDGA